MEKKSDTLVIYHHMGLGDHITCHGIVRHYCEIWENVLLCVKPHNLNNVQYMYNDLKNLRYIVGDDYQIVNFLQQNKFQDVLCVGAVTVNGWNSDLLKSENGNFEKQFYEMAEVPFEYKYEKFHINRDMEKEMSIF